MLLLFPESKRAEVIANSPYSDHLPCQFSRPLNIIACPCGHLLQHNLLSRPASHKDPQVLIRKSLEYVYLSSKGNCCVTPRALPLGMMFTL